MEKIRENRIYCSNFASKLTYENIHKTIFAYSFTNFFLSINVD